MVGCWDHRDLLIELLMDGQATHTFKSSRPAERAKSRNGVSHMVLHRFRRGWGLGP